MAPLWVDFLRPAFLPFNSCRVSKCTRKSPLLSTPPLCCRVTLKDCCYCCCCCPLTPPLWCRCRGREFEEALSNVESAPGQLQLGNTGLLDQDTTHDVLELYHQLITTYRFTDNVSRCPHPSRSPNILHSQDSRAAALSHCQRNLTPPCVLCVCHVPVWVLLGVQLSDYSGWAATLLNQNSLKRSNLTPGLTAKRRRVQPGNQNVPPQ